jgi:hypothetical protein
VCENRKIGWSDGTARDATSAPQAPDSHEVVQNAVVDDTQARILRWMYVGNRAPPGSGRLLTISHARLGLVRF